MSPIHSNRPRLDDIVNMPIGALAALPAEELALLQEEARTNLDSAKRLAEWVNGAILLKYDERAITALIEHGKSFGTVRFGDGEVTVIADVPKKVDWDQKKLATVIEMIRASGDNPSDYVATEYKVSERAYSAWPSRIREVFEPARTTRLGKATIRLALESPEQQRGRP